MGPPPPSPVHKSGRKLKIVYDDPDATESSSDERNSIIVDRTKRKRVVLEISMPNVPCDQSVDNGLNKNDKNCEKQKRIVQSCKYKGVRMRQGGRWAAEIRNPINGGRNWLGTFDSPEEASRAYEAKKHEFDTLYEKGLCNRRRNKNFKNVATNEPMVASLNDSKSNVLNISLSSPELVKSVEVLIDETKALKKSLDIVQQPNVEVSSDETKSFKRLGIAQQPNVVARVEVSSDETNSLKPLDIVQQQNVVASVDTSSQLDLDWLTFDCSELDLKDLSCLDDSNNIDIPFDFDYFGTESAVHYGVPSLIEEPRNRRIEERHNRHIKEPRNRRIEKRRNKHTKEPCNMSRP